MSALLGTNADWYLMRASGFVALALLTVSLGLGVANIARLQTRTWTRAVGVLVHRNASLLALVFTVIHVVTAISDRYVDIPLASIVVPGLSGYDPLWVGLGAVATDLMIAVTVTSLLRARLGYRTWQAVHWSSYLLWPVAMVHSIGSGSGAGVDTARVWSLAFYVLVGLLFLAAVAIRLGRGRGDRLLAGRPQPAAPSLQAPPPTPLSPHMLRRTSLHPNDQRLPR